MPQKKPGREKEPFIKQGDEVFISSSGGAGGAWRVAAARWYDDHSDRIAIVLRRGSMGFKTEFNRKTMQVRSNRPAHKLTRSLNTPKTASFRKKAA